MYRLGQWTDEPLTSASLPCFCDDARVRADCLGRADVAEGLALCERLHALWSADGDYAAHAAEAMVPRMAETGDRDARALTLLPEAMSRGRWEQCLRIEFDDPSILDGPRRLPRGVARAYPLGIVLHVLDRGSVLDIVDSVLACLLTKNIPVLCVPEATRRFVTLFLQSLEAADRRGAFAGAVAAFTGVDRCPGIEAHVDAVVSCERPAVAADGTGHAGRKARFIERVVPDAVGVISKAYWDRCDHAKLVAALVGTRGRGDSSLPSPAQRVYVETGLDLESWSTALTDVATPALSAPELLPYRSADALRSAVGALPVPPTLCRYGLEPEERAAHLHALARGGVRHFVPLDRDSDGTQPVDAIGFAMRELVHLVTDAQDFGVEELLCEAAAQVPFYAERRPSAQVSRLSAWPLLTAADLARDPLHHSRTLLNTRIAEGSIFSSGGTSTAPKYALYTPAEFSRSAEMLAHGFLANGLRPGDRVINLFVAGHLWSSFIVVDDALRRCGVYVLPMGGLSPPEEIAACLVSFKPQVAFGLPSLLVDCARHCEQSGLDVTVDRVFYGGEHLNPSARRYLQTVWKTTSFHSAGYAAVDVGPIGWQCVHCKAGEHHLFAREVHLEIVDEEAVVTSLVRRAMPVIRYRTGDRVEWLPEACPCGSPDPRFRLLGRVDGIMNIWGCRLAFEDVERSLLEAGMTASILQLVLTAGTTLARACQETLIVRLEQPATAPDFSDRFTENLHRYSKDAALALDLSTLRQRVHVECVAPESIPRIARTGKVRLIVDQRDSGSP